MDFYFSGLRDRRDVALLRDAGVPRVLVDPHDARNAADFPHAILDSGAYRAWKAGKPLDVARLLLVAHSRPWDFVVADVFGDAEAGLNVWRDLVAALPGQPVMPVWPWGADKSLLATYLAEAPVVGLGGLVPLLRNRFRREFADPEYERWEIGRYRLLEELAALVAQFPGRCHAFGLCWAPALDALWPALYSADTSHWLTTRRTGLALHVDRAGALGEAHWRDLDYPDPAAAVAGSIVALRDFAPVTWVCAQCGQIGAHHQVRLDAFKACPDCGGQMQAVRP